MKISPYRLNACIGFNYHGNLISTTIYLKHTFESSSTVKKFTLLFLFEVMIAFYISHRNYILI